MSHPSLIEDLLQVCGPSGVRHRMADLLVYEADGSVDGAVETTLPLAVVLPTSTEQVAGAVKVARKHGVPIVARTFHAIAYDIIGIVEGTKPALADHATDDMAFTNLIG